MPTLFVMDSSTRLANVIGTVQIPADPIGTNIDPGNALYGSVIVNAGTRQGPLFMSDGTRFFGGGTGYLIYNLQDGRTLVSIGSGCFGLNPSIKPLAHPAPIRGIAFTICCGWGRTRIWTVCLHLSVLPAGRVFKCGKVRLRSKICKPAIWF